MSAFALTQAARSSLLRMGHIRLALGVMAAVWPSKETLLSCSPLSLLMVALLSVFLGAPAAQAQTYELVYNFRGSGDGQDPNGRLIHDADGNLYGVTTSGGAHNSGTVFKLDANGHETVLYSFTGGSDGGFPLGGVIRDPAGNLYGTTDGGGSNQCSCGTVFRLDAGGTLTVLHTFQAGTDGALARTGLVAFNGILYGTTDTGGGAGCAGSGPGAGCGIIFKVTKGGKYTVLYRFTGTSDGQSPQDLVTDSLGNLYGATSASTTGAGTVFKLDTVGTLTVLYTFTGGADGGLPVGRLLRNANGTIHGVTEIGGDFGCLSSGCGVVYRLDPAGNEKVLHRFCCRPNGIQPIGGLVDVSGSLYGMTASGGDLNCFLGSGCGALFRIDNTGKFTVLHRFAGGADGEFPGAGASLTFDSDGSIYGSTEGGGNGCSGDCGVIFKLTP